MDAMLTSAALNALPHPMAITDREGRIAFVNAAFCALNGYTPDEVLGQNPRLLKSGRTNPQVYAELWQAVAAGRAFTGRVVNRKKNGEHYEAELTVVPLPDASGNVTHYLSTHRDLTPLLASQAALRRSETSLRALIEGLPDTIGVHRDGKLIFVNRAALALLGYTNDSELLGQPASILFQPGEPFETVAANPVELRLRRRDGTSVPAEVIAQRLIFDELPAVVLKARDLTSSKELAARMMHLDRMVAVGTLAAGVGHEINNPLAYVIGNLDFATQELGSVPASCACNGCLARIAEANTALKEAREGATRVREVVRDLKMMSGGGSDHLEMVRLERILESSINMAFGEIRNRARLVKDFAPVPPVRANGSRLGQVALNLLVNAAHAIGEGRIADNEIRVTLSSDGTDVVFSVTDTGAGIPPHVLPKIFDPFFTTKPPGQGTGLGLSIVRGIVHQFDGKIDVTSAVGRGTTFTIRLPIEPTVAEPSTRPPSAGGGRGKVLVIDDEPLVAQAVARTLAHEHDVTIAPGAAEALARIAGGERFDVIYCDLMMPGMDGMALYAALAEDDPRVAAKVIFLTGGAHDDAAVTFLESIPNAHLDKPFDAVQIRAITRERLGTA